MLLVYPYCYDGESSYTAYLSDFVLSNSHIFFIGLIVGISICPTFAFAEDGIAINPHLDTIVIAGGMAENYRNIRPSHQMAMLNRRQITARIAAISTACGTAVPCVPELTEKGIDRKNKNPKTFAVIGCVFIAGWCAGKVVDHVLINR